MKDYLVVGKEKSKKIEAEYLNGLNFNGGIKEFFLELRAKIAIEEGVDPVDIKITEFKANCSLPGVPEFFRCNYVVYAYIDRDAVEKAYTEYINSLGGSVSNMRFSSGSNTICICMTLPKAIYDRYMKDYGEKYGLISLEGDIKKSYPGYYPMIFCNVKTI